MITTRDKAPTEAKVLGAWAKLAFANTYGTGDKKYSDFDLMLRQEYKLAWEGDPTAIKFMLGRLDANLKARDYHYPEAGQGVIWRGGRPPRYRGGEPAAAIAAVRAVRPGAIETTAQLGHVMALAPVEEEQPATALEAMADRALGAMLGLAVGDALGTSLEFTPRDSRPRLVDMTGGGPFHLKPGEWTDDTAMALALMDSLVAHPGLDETDLMDRFVAWYERGTYSCTGTCFDIGITTRAALTRYKRTGDPVAGSPDPMSAGNGSLMRLAPVAIRHWNDPHTVRDVAARQSRTTHAAPEAVDACIAFAQLLARAIGGAPRSQVLQPRATTFTGAIAPILAGSWRGKPRRDHS
jgi:ADP-ribosyl-[dinitrogen reductase] hydrolase